MITWLTATASAADPFWSAAGYVGTRFAPNAYPAAFPPRIDSYDFDGDGEDSPDDVDGDGRMDGTTLEAVRGDFHGGVEGHRWVAGNARLGVAAEFDVGSRYSEVATLAFYEKGFDLETLVILAGGGVGFGTATWRGGDDDERLRLPHYPFRAQAGVVGQVTDTLALQGRLFGQVAVPASHDYRDLAGNEQEVHGVPFLYASIGLQVGVVYGNFGRVKQALEERAATPDAPVPAPTAPAAPAQPTPPVAPAPAGPAPAEAPAEAPAPSADDIRGSR